ncbi:hypothetical protein [Ammonifex thiophilus]|uniref:hypothetical protein n=1 Tax=Ammonifex thiophilus TaxID=444093 RepID=UPI001402BD62|nr:hypothetical protein [Ammonifex thiophilus]
MSCAFQDLESFSRWKEADGDLIRVRKVCIDVTGDLVAGILLSRIIDRYLSGESKELKPGRDGELWLVKGREEWWEECRITPKQFDRAVALLEQKGIVEKKVFKFNGVPTVHVRFIPEAFLRLLSEVARR